MRKTVSIRRALTDPQLLGNSLDGESWAAWRILLTAAMGEPLDPAELEIFTKLTGRTVAPSEPMKELCVLAGRRGGKSRALSVLGVYLACLCEFDGLATGELPMVSVIALDASQASVAMSYAVGAIEESPLLSQMIRRKTPDMLELTNKVAFRATGPSFRRIRGRTLIAALCDEISFWFQNADSANPDSEVLRAIRPALSTTGGPLIMLSSAYLASGELYERYKQHYGADGSPAILCAKGASRDFNPTLDEALIQQAMEDDPEAASAEYMSEFRLDLEAFIGRHVVEAAYENGVWERPYRPGYSYVAFCDPSGGSKDSMTLGIAHRESSGRAVLDALREVKPPFDPDAVVEDFVKVMQSYRLRSLRGDAYAGAWVSQSFRRHGMHYRQADLTKSQIYIDALPLLMSGQVELLDNKTLVTQLCGLQRRNRFGGKGASIDHGPRGHDDVSNAAAGAIVYAKSNKAVAHELDGRRAPQVLTSQNSTAAERKARQMPKSSFGKAAIEDAMMNIPTPESYPVGEYGHRIMLMHIANDQREQWRLCDPFGQPLGMVWGKEAAIAAIEKIISMGHTNGP